MLPGYFNSTLNPIIYVMTNHDFKAGQEHSMTLMTIETTPQKYWISFEQIFIYEKEEG